MTEDDLIESAEAELAQRGQLAVAAIRSQLTGPGRDECADCGAEIGEARRAALPSAERCIGCQSRIERDRGCRR